MTTNNAQMPAHQTRNWQKDPKAYCRHWKGMEMMRQKSGLCDGGHDPRIVTGGSASGWLLRCPCINGNKETKCADFSCRTDEEIAQREREINEAFEQVMADMPIIANIKHSCKPGEQGTRECHRCGGQLWFARAITNGHLRIKCSTDGCLTMME